MAPFRRILVVVATATALMALGTAARAQTGPAASASAPATTEPIAMADGEVRRVDKNAARLTLRHGPLPKLNMAGMTMSFAVQDARVLDQFKEGDKVRFAVDRVNGVLTVIAIEPVR